MLEQFKGCRIQPLQIVEEQSERMLRASEYVEEPPKHSWKRFCASSGASSGTGGCFPIDRVKLRNQVDDELTVWAEGLPQRVPPMAQFSIAINQNLTMRV